MKGLRGFIIKRILQGMLALFILITLLFFMFRLLPGDPTTMFVDAALPVEAQEAVKEQFGLDKPLMEQYFTYVGNIFKGEFGISFSNREPVFDVIMYYMPATLLLMGASVGIALVGGVVIGALLAWLRGTAFESVTASIVLFFRSAPVFWVGMVALAIFSHQLNWFPTGGMMRPGQLFDSLFDQFFRWEFLHHLILPAIVGALYYIATPMLVMRSSMVDIMDEDFIEMAHAKGLKEKTILFKHAVRNALLPVTTEIALLIGFAIGGQVLLEVVFNWPGIGRLIVDAVQMNDYPVAMATFFLMGMLVIVLNIISDILYVYLDPRVRL